MTWKILEVLIQSVLGLAVLLAVLVWIVGDDDNKE